MQVSRQKSPLMESSSRYSYTGLLLLTEVRLILRTKLATIAFILCFLMMSFSVMLCCNFEASPRSLLLKDSLLSPSRDSWFKSEDRLKGNSSLLLLSWMLSRQVSYFPFLFSPSCFRDRLVRLLGLPADYADFKVFSVLSASC
jgi:hypothetical protein